MAKVITLSAGGVLLTFDCDDNNWCHLTFSTGSSNMRIGAEVFQDLVWKFLDMLLSREHLSCGCQLARLGSFFSCPTSFRSVA